MNAISRKLPNCSVSFRQGRLRALQIEEPVWHHKAEGGEVPSSVFRDRSRTSVSASPAGAAPQTL